MAEVLGILTHPHPTCEAVRTLKDAGFKDLEVYSRVESIPSELRCNLAPLEIGQAIRVGEFEYPEGVRAAMPDDELVVMIHAPKLITEDEPEGEEGAEPGAEADSDVSDSED